VGNYLAYYDMATTKALKDSIIQAPDVVAIISMEHLIILKQLHEPSLPVTFEQAYLEL
jgi:hypothetical protein